MHGDIAIIYRAAAFISEQLEMKFSPKKSKCVMISNTEIQPPSLHAPSKCWCSRANTDYHAMSHKCCIFTPVTSSNFTYMSLSAKTDQVCTIN